MTLVREPGERLRAFVKVIWRSEAPWIAAREHILPNGFLHLALRLSGPPVCLFRDDDDWHGQHYGYAVVGGPRSRYYIKGTPEPSVSIGAVLRPDAALPLFGALPSELSESHTRLGDLWGAQAAFALDQLCSARSPQQQLDLFEQLLAQRLPAVRALHPAVATALDALATGCTVRHAVQATAYSHRHLALLFRDATGLLPKSYCRVRRFQHALEAVRQYSTLSLAQVACSSGYSDQAHFQREFLSMAGVTPLAYRRLGPMVGQHVPMVHQRETR